MLGPGPDGAGEASHAREAGFEAADRRAQQPRSRSRDGGVRDRFRQRAPECARGLAEGEAGGEKRGRRPGLHRRGITIVWIEHIVHVLVQVAERLVCMDAGRIIADGAPGAVLSDAPSAFSICPACRAWAWSR